MTEDRRKRDTPRAQFTRRAYERTAPDHSVDFGDLPTVPMDLYPQDQAIPTAEVIREGEIDKSWEELVAAVEQKGRGA